jgi:ectoine hydroxylase-related dioxygenase (phytanoyl-CoA dioxygenase family)
MHTCAAGKSGMCCIQGLVTFTDATASSGGLCVIPGSHLRHEYVSDMYGQRRGDFVPIYSGEPMLKGRSQLVTARAGVKNMYVYLELHLLLVPGLDIVG